VAGSVYNTFCVRIKFVINLFFKYWSSVFLGLLTIWFAIATPDCCLVIIPPIYWEYYAIIVGFLFVAYPALPYKVHVRKWMGGLIAGVYSYRLFSLILLQDSGISDPRVPTNFLIIVLLIVALPNILPRSNKFLSLHNSNDD
jgi:hypothetical protein